MKELIIDFAKILIPLLLGGFGMEWYRKWLNRKKDNIEVTQAYVNGSVMEIQFKTDLNKLVEESIKPLKAKITELEESLVTSAVKYNSDLKNYINRMSDLEDKLDVQQKRNQDLESKLEQEIILKETYLTQLTVLKNRVTELEAFKK